MNTHYLTRSESRFWSTEFPVGDPFGGAAYGERRDPGTLAIGSSIISGGLGSRAARRAEKTAERTTGMQIDETRRQYDTTREDTRAYREVGESALYRLSDLYGIDTSAQRLENLRRQRDEVANLADFQGDFWDRRTMGEGGDAWVTPERRNMWMAARDKRLSDLDAQITQLGAGGGARMTPQQILEQMPGYQFRMSQGNTAVDRLAAATGVTGGRRLKEAMRYNQDFASNEFGNAAEGLFRMSGMGSNAVNTTASAGANAVNNINSAYANRGAAEANAGMVRANSLNNAIQGGLDNYMTMSMYNNMMNRFPTPTAGGSGFTAGVR